MISDRAHFIRDLPTVPAPGDNSTTLQLQLQLRYTTLHPAVVGEVTD